MILNMAAALKNKGDVHFNNISVQTLMLEMADGVRLQTIVCLPKGIESCSVLLCRTPYAHMQNYFTKMGELYAQSGYGFVFQFVRGTNKSEGAWEPNVHERNDGIDTLNWLNSQIWCESIGIHGISYMALTGWIVADALPDKVKGLYLCHYGVDRHLSAYKDGLFRQDILTAWAIETLDKEIENGKRPDYIKTALYRPHADSFNDLWGIDLPWYREWVTNTDYESEYWHSGVWETLKSIPRKINVPVCVVAGWFDHHLEGTLLGYEMLNTQTKSKSRLIVGTWDHDFAPGAKWRNEESAYLNMHEVMYDWFESLFKGGDEKSERIMVHVSGSDKWITPKCWPIKPHEVKTYYLTSELSDNHESYFLSEHYFYGDSIKYEYNPNDPVHTQGGETVFASRNLRGSIIQNETGYRSDIISFVSEELTEDMMIAGKMKVCLKVSSDCEDTCFTVKVDEALPDGSAYNIRTGLTTLAYRNGLKSRGEYMPFSQVKIEIELLPITWCIKKGSKIRVDISSSDFPQYSVHTNTAGIWSLQNTAKKAKQTLHFDKHFKPCIKIPIMN